MTSILEPFDLLTKGRERVLAVLDELLGESRDGLATSLERAFAETTRANIERYVLSYRASFLEFREKLQIAAQIGHLDIDIVNAAVSIHDEARSFASEEWRVWMARIAGAADFAAAEAPFSRWVAAFGADGVYMDALARVRRDMDDVPQLEFPDIDVLAEVSTHHWSSEQIELFHRQALRVLGNLESPELDRVRDAFGLSKTELGALFGVSRQAVAQWLYSGELPSEREEKLATVAAIADLLEHRLKDGRLRGAARRPASAYDGRTMLEMIAADRHRELLDMVRESFDWSRVA